MTEVEIEFSEIGQVRRKGKCPVCKTMFESPQGETPFYIEIPGFHGYFCSLDCMKVAIEKGIDHVGPTLEVCIYCDQPWPEHQEGEEK